MPFHEFQAVPLLHLITGFLEQGLQAPCPLTTTHAHAEPTSSVLLSVLELGHQAPLQLQNSCNGDRNENQRWMQHWKKGQSAAAPGSRAPGQTAATAHTDQQFGVRAQSGCWMLQTWCWAQNALQLFNEQI